MLTFMCGHAPFELTAIVVSGAAGLRLGRAMLAPGGMTRWGALRQASRPVGTLVLGAAGLLLVAAGIEGFWSPSAASPHVKWTVAALGAVLVSCFLLFAGRRQRR
jgi:uncharacterized membrane protein SpoIIM required for sporulation